MAHVSKRKQETVARLEKTIKSYPVVGIVDLQSVPASQLAKIREKLREHMLLVMTKKNLMKIVFAKVEPERKGISKLLDCFQGMPSLILSKESPFKIANLLAKNKTSAPAKEGQHAPHDLTIPAGPTPFTPGPVIGELGMLGIKSGVENGKIVIKVDATVARAGEKINSKVASLLGRLGIQPMEIGIKVNGIFENGEIFKREVLDIDPAEYITRLQRAYSGAQGLTLEIGYVTKDNVKLFLAKAHRQAMGIATEGNIVTKDTLGLILGKADIQSKALKDKIGFAEG